MWPAPDARTRRGAHPGRDERRSDVSLDGRLGLVLDDLHDGLLGSGARRGRLRRRPLGAKASGREAFVTVSARELTLVTTGECHLCERAHLLLADLGVRAREISVESSEANEIAARGIPLSFLPVLTDGERAIAYGRFSEKRLRKELSL